MSQKWNYYRGNDEQNEMTAKTVWRDAIKVTIVLPVGKLPDSFDMKTFPVSELRRLGSQLCELVKALSQLAVDSWSPRQTY